MTPSVAPGTYPTTASGTPAPSYMPPGSDRRTLMWVGGLVVVIVALIFVLATLRQPVAGTIHVTTQPADAQVLLDGAPVGGNASPFVLTEVSPSEPHVLEVRKEGYVTWKTKLTLRSAQVVTLPPVQLMSAQPEPPKPVAAVPAPGTLLQRDDAHVRQIWKRVFGSPRRGDHTPPLPCKKAHSGFANAG